MGKCAFGARGREYLKDKYEYEIPKVQDDQVDNLNEQASEAKRFICGLSDALKNGWKADDKRLQQMLENHILCLKNYGHSITAKSFAAQTRFFLEDDFHRNMLEKQQIGLSYYLCIAAEMYATSN